jgi:hypothetical protein
MADARTTIVVDPSGKNLTLDELARFVQDARRAGAVGTEVVKARVSIGGALRQLEIAVRQQDVSDTPSSY